MPADALELLYTVALSPEGVDLALVESLHPDAGRFLDLALQRRLVEISNDRVACRHELIRESLSRAIPESMSRRLHRSLLAFLEEKGGDSADIARKAYHSIEAWTASEPPNLFGLDLHQHPVLPLWVLHAWIWKDNPAGMFEDFNPAVRLCPEGVPVFGEDLP